MRGITKGTVASALVFALLTGAASATDEGLSELEARKDAKLVLERHFKANWVYGNFKRVRCGARLSLYKRRCQVSWGIGDTAYRGKVTIRDPGGQIIYYSFVIRKINQYCQATGGTNCVKIIAR
jgi:hypothetical protein